MSPRTALLGVATVMIVVGSIVVALGDLRHDPRSSRRAAVEALVPLAGVGALLWWTWASM